MFFQQPEIRKGPDLNLLLMRSAFAQSILLLLALTEKAWADVVPRACQGTMIEDKTSWEIAIFAILVNFSPWRRQK